jgi:hypothetical protein
LLASSLRTSSGSWCKYSAIFGNSSRASAARFRGHQPPQRMYRSNCARRDRRVSAGERADRKGPWLFDARTARERNLTPGRQFSVGQTATHVWQIATQLSTCHRRCGESEIPRDRLLPLDRRAKPFLVEKLLLRLSPPFRKPRPTSRGIANSWKFSILADGGRF